MPSSITCLGLPKLGLQDILYLGNLDAIRDWGYAKDYVEAIWRMLQQDRPRDLVIATGQSYSVRDFIELVYRELGFDIQWEGSGSDEIGIDRESQKILIKVDSRYFRPTEVPHLHGDPTHAAELLGWKPQTSFRELVKIMVDADYKKLSGSVLK